MKKNCMILYYIVSQKLKEIYFLIFFLRFLQTSQLKLWHFFWAYFDALWCVISAKKKIPSLFSLLLLPRLFPLPLWPFKAILFLDFWVFFPPIHSGTWCQNAYDSTDYKVSTHNFLVSLYIDSKAVKSSKNLMNYSLTLFGRLF